MARSTILDTTIDVNKDDGGVLLSFVQGEAFEYPVTLKFLSNAGAGYVYEAVIMEAANVLGSEEVPTAPRTGGINTTLTVRVPLERGEWNAASAYDREDVVEYGLIYYKLKSGTGRVNATPPSSDINFWDEYNPNQVYLQFPETITLSPAWSVLPTIKSAVYGYFELSVREPTGGVFRRTWKPMRGLVKYEYSPTQVV